MEKQADRVVNSDAVPVRIEFLKTKSEIIPSEETVSNSELIDNYQIDVEFAKEKLAKVERLFANLAAVMSKITPDCYQHDRTKFNTLNAEAEEQILKIESLLVGLSTKTEIEYSRPPRARRLVFWFLSFVSARAWQIRQTYLNAWNTHNALMSAVNQYGMLIKNQRLKIDDIRFYKINRRAEEILFEWIEYKDICQKLPKVREQLNNAVGFEAKRRYTNQLAALNERLEQFRGGARTLALKQFKDEEF